MAIAPIDLQTLFTQLDKVGKAQLSQNEGQALQQAIQGTIIQRKTVEHIREVNEAQNTGDGIEKIKDRGEDGKQQGQAGGGKKEKGQSESGEAGEAGEEGQPSILQDPSLGRNIDISL